MKERIQGWQDVFRRSKQKWWGLRHIEPLSVHRSVRQIRWCLLSCWEQVGHLQSHPGPPQGSGSWVEGDLPCEWRGIPALSLWLIHQLLPAPTPKSGVGYRRAKVHFPKRVFFTFWQVKCKGTQTSQSHSIQTAHWKTQNPVSKSLSFTFQVLILIGFEFCSYSVIKYLQNLD